MAQKIKFIEDNDLKEGTFFCKWLNQKLIVRNKNVLSVELGSTGSGKSYRDLRKAELWYQYHFKEEYPPENICFGVKSILKRIKELNDSKKLRKGTIIIFEEAGANLGNLDFQNKISKMFNYVLQSFRSMNIGIFFNLPYFSMLNKTARMLIHFSGESDGVNKSKKLNYCRPFTHQVNQKSGKIYNKFPKVKVNGRTRKLKRLVYKMPSQYLIDAYETKKKEFLDEIINRNIASIEDMEFKERRVLEKKPLTEQQQLIFDCLTKEGLNQKQTAEKIEKSGMLVCNQVKLIRKKGYMPYK